MAFIRAGRKVFNPDHIVSAEETVPAGPKGEGRRIRVDFIGGSHTYFSGDEITPDIAALIDNPDNGGAGRKGGK